MLINKKAVKAAALEIARKHRGGKFTRVSKSFLESVDGKVKNMIEGHVRSLPSVGKTIK